MTRRIMHRARALAGACALFAGMPASAAEDGAPVLDLSLEYISELQVLASGGLDPGATYLDQFNMAFTLDAGRAFGLSDTTIHVSALASIGGNFSERRVGDLQTVSNIETGRTVRPFEAWFDHDFGPGALKLGLIDLNSEFDAGEVAGNFVNSSHGIGPEFAQIGPNGPGIFPNTGLGARLLLKPFAHGVVRAGVFEGVPGDPTHPDRFSASLKPGEGVLAVAEADLRPAESLRIVLGGWHHSGARFGEAEAKAGGGTGAYAIVEGQLRRFSRHSLSGFVRLGGAWGSSRRVTGYIGAGLLAAGPMLGGEDRAEIVGLAVAAAFESEDFREMRRAAGGIAGAAEVALEAIYRARLTPWLQIQPNIQYIINPDADAAIPDALVVGLRLNFTL